MFRVCGWGAVRRELSRFGEVEGVQIATDCMGRSRCFGFVTFKKERVAESLIGQGSCRVGVSSAVGRLKDLGFRV